MQIIIQQPIYTIARTALTTIQFPDGTTNLYSYNSQGNVIKSPTGGGTPRPTQYDALNRETGSTDALNDITTIT